ncbi:uncharacterized protein LOC127264948 [Andrographis paniculata]|uniref:uncharacterized protein LOC127264948 n=1 Tax=Andrographis paniculata TaxID=175694 RepID=UPI0021E8A596|nr:uncharacterized protein LOC127264948 [Andrographis paniculata]XP_051150517.1 uncharacterized protein LOC127264948 [Andrographis paniculata]XP_051150518.1 uncharacterized protein LOC127264948 [Andrographis paniculata]
MSGGGGGLSKLGVALTVIFAITLVALFGQLFHFLWRRRVEQRQILRGGDTDHLNLYNSSSNSSSFSSKELLYFLCIRAQSRNASNSVTSSGAVDDRRRRQLELDVEGIDVDVFQIQGMFGPPRFLFTIKEEEKEDLESPADTSLHSADRLSRKIGDVSRNCTESGSLGAGEDEAVQQLRIIDDQDTTPFSTPCASPSFFTPATSPVHERSRSVSQGN